MDVFKRKTLGPPRGKEWPGNFTRTNDPFCPHVPSPQEPRPGGRVETRVKERNESATTRQEASGLWPLTPLSALLENSRKQSPHHH